VIQRLKKTAEIWKSTTMSKHKATITTTKERTFSSPKAAVKYARRLEAKGEISKAELRGVEHHARQSKSSSSKKR
jgi:hypothetical protein